MAPNTISSRSFQISQVFKSLWELVTRNILFWFFLLVVLHFIAWEFKEEFWGSLQSYPLSKPAIDLILCNIANLDPDIRKGVDFFANSIVYSMLLQVVIGPVIYDVLQKKNGDQKIRAEDITARFQKEKGDFILDVLRTAGIVVIYYSIYALYIGLLISLGLESPLRILVALIIYLGFLYCMIRWALAVPVTVIENMGVFKSFERSWHLTASCWIKFSAVNILTFILAMIFLGVIFYLAKFLLGSEFWNGENIEKITSNVTVIIASWFAAMALSVCYYYLSNVRGKVSS